MISAHIMNMPHVKMLIVFLFQYYEYCLKLLAYLQKVFFEVLFYNLIAHFYSY